MTYAANILDDNIESIFLAILRPRYQFKAGAATVFGTQHGRTVYSVPFTYGYISSLVVYTDDSGGTVAGFFNTTSYNLVADIATVGTGGTDYFFDYDNQVLYTVGDPANAVAFFEVYCATKASNWYRSPLDSTTQQVHFEGVISKPPDQMQSVSDVIFGIIPTQSTFFEIANTEMTFQKLMYDAVWNKAAIEVYHAVGKLNNTANIAKIITGYVDTLLIKDDVIQIKLLSATSLLDSKWSNAVVEYDYMSNGWGSGQPIPKIYGMVDGIPAMNNYPTIPSIPSSTSPNNVIWTVGQAACMSADLTATPLTSGSNTTTRTYFTDVSGFNVDDEIWGHKTGPTDYYCNITAVNRGSNYIDHTANAGAMDNTFTVTRGSVGYAWMVSAGVTYKMRLHRDFTYANTTGIPYKAGWYIILDVNSWSNVGMPRKFDNTDRLYVRAYGAPNTSITLAASPFIANNTKYNCVTNGFAFVYDLLKTAGISESDIDTATFSTLAAASTEFISFKIPQSYGSDFPTFKEVLQTLCQTLLCKLFIDSNNQWSIAKIAPISSVDKTLLDDDLIEKFFEYTLTYADVLSRVQINFNFSDWDPYNENPGGATIPSVYSNFTALTVQKVANQKVFESYLMGARDDNTSQKTSTDASTLAKRLGFIFGDRRGFLKITTRHPQIQTKMSNNIAVSRDRMPGYALVLGTPQTRNFGVTEIKKSLRTVELTLDDQKGVQDNSGSW